MATCNCIGKPRRDGQGRLCDHEPDTPPLTVRTCTATYRDSFLLNDFNRSLPAMPCFKIVDDQGRHRGQHQTFVPYPALEPDPTHHLSEAGRRGHPAGVRLVDWSNGGSSSRGYDPNVPNTNCMCRNENNRLGHKPEDHHWTPCADCGSILDATKAGPVRCFSCGEWAKRVADATAGRWRYLRPHTGMSAGRVYSFSASNPGGFGGARFTITMDDGTVVAKDQAGLWDAGDVPWWVDEEFPPNCTIESGSGTTKVPGHTTGFGGQGRPLTFTGGPEPTK